MLNDQKKVLTILNKIVKWYKGFFDFSREPKLYDPDRRELLSAIPLCWSSAEKSLIDSDFPLMFTTKGVFLKYSKKEGIVLLYQMPKIERYGKKKEYPRLNRLEERILSRFGYTRKSYAREFDHSFEFGSGVMF